MKAKNVLLLGLAAMTIGIGGELLSTRASFNAKAAPQIETPAPATNGKTLEFVLSALAATGGTLTAAYGLGRRAAELDRAPA